MHGSSGYWDCEFFISSYVATWPRAMTRRRVQVTGVHGGWSKPKLRLPVSHKQRTVLGRCWGASEKLRQWGLGEVRWTGWFSSPSASGRDDTHLAGGPRELRSSSPPAPGVLRGSGPPSSRPASGRLEPHPSLTGFCAAPANTRDTAASIFLMERSRLTRWQLHPGTQKEWFGRPQVSLRRPEPRPRPKRSDGVGTASRAAPACGPIRTAAGEGSPPISGTCDRPLKN